MNTIDRVAEDFGGRDEFVDACRLSTAPIVQTFVRLAEECDKEGLADICSKTNLAPDKLLELMVPALYRWNGAVGKMLNAINVPKTMKAGIETANLVGAEGFQDRKMQFQMAGLLQKEGSGVNVFNTVNVGDLESFEETVIDVTPKKMIEGEDVQSQDNS
jgi:hypothetical protein